MSTGSGTDAGAALAPRAREVDGVPPPPRRARWRTVLGRRAWLGLVGGALLLAGGLLLLPWAPSLRGGFEDLALATSAEQAGGEVTQVVPEAQRIAGTTWDRVQYRFRTGDGAAPLTGASYLPHPAPPHLAPGAPVTVEYLSADPVVSRAAGTSRAPAAPHAGALTTAMLLGVLLVLAWLRGALRLKVALAEGAAVAAVVCEVRCLRWLYPVLLRTRYTYRTAAGSEHEARQWLVASSALGRDLVRGAAAIAIYDVRRAALSRLVTAGDFSA